MKNISRAVVVVNIFGAGGYLLLLMAWIFFCAVMVATPLELLAQTYSVDAMQKSAAFSTTSSATVIVATYAITVVVIVVSIGILVTLPYFVGKWGSRLLRRIMVLLKIPMTKRQLFLVKSMLATIPLIGFMIVNITVVPESMTFGAMYVATLVASVVSIVLFFVQLLIARRLGVLIEKIW